jgi:hypothetical protein
MNLVSFNNLIIKIFKSHGFEINSSSDYSKYIFATKDNINLSVGYSDPNDELNLSKVRNFFRSAKRDSADMLIYVITKTTYPTEIDKFTNDRNIQLWDRERFERELGRAVMESLESTGETGEFGAELQAISEPGSTLHADPVLDPDLGLPGVGFESDSASSDTSTETVPIMVPIIPFADDEPGEIMVAGSPEISSTESSMETRAESTASESISPEDRNVRIIKPKVSKDKAANMASKIVRGFRFNLELIPYYIFSYALKFDTDKPEDKPTNGWVGINGLTSNIEEWKGKFDTVSNLHEEHTKLEVKFPYEQAFSLAKDAVVELNTKSVETRDESENTIIFEKKRLKPKTDAINITSKGIYYLPVWCIEGSNGLMIIDANSGKIIKEDSY